MPANESLPILYSFRRCPYAIRARMAITLAGIEYEHREVLLKEKPASMLLASSKGTVPVLLSDGVVIDESLDVMQWALSSDNSVSLKWAANGFSEFEEDAFNHPLIKRNDNEFKPKLDRYKYSDRHPEYSQDHYFNDAVEFLVAVNAQIKMQNGRFISGVNPSVVDLAIFPFVRQFAYVDLGAFAQLALPKLQNWLDYWLKSELFLNAMQKHAVWQEGEKGIHMKAESIDHNEDEKQFVIRAENGDESFLKYRFTGDQEVDFYSTFVPNSQRGRGIAGKLVDAAYAWAQDHQYAVKTSCWYAEKRLAG